MESSDQDQGVHKFDSRMTFGNPSLSSANLQQIPTPSSRQPNTPFFEDEMNLQLGTPKGFLDCLKTPYRTR